MVVRSPYDPDGEAAKTTGAAVRPNNLSGRCVRMFSYNIFEGGEGRADELAEVIAAQRADIVALIEADNIDVLERIAARLDMDYIQAAGKKHSVAVLSRWAMVESINHSHTSAAGRTRPSCLLEALIKDSAGREWVVGAVHLHPRAGEADEEIREEEVTGLLDLFEHHRLAHRPHILAGDFNANSPIQEIDPEKTKESTREDWRRNGGVLPRRVIQRLINAGYVDTLHAVKGEAAGRMGTFTTQHPGQRVDYVFAHGLSNQLTDAWIEQDRLAKYSSDHFPIGAAFD